MQNKRTLLQREMDRIRIQIAELEKTLEARPEYGLGKGNPAAAGREVDRALLQRLTRRAESLEQALARLNQGLYGVCVQCGRPIHAERLAVLPDAKRCVDCAKRKKTTTASLRRQVA